MGLGLGFGLGLGLGLGLGAAHDEVGDLLRDLLEGVPVLAHLAEMQARCGRDIGEIYGRHR